LNCKYCEYWFVISGGGAPPVPTTPQATTAISLAPVGTTPVAIFPPYATPRTVPSISVIYAENPSLLISKRTLTVKTSGNSIISFATFYPV